MTAQESAIRNQFIQDYGIDALKSTSGASLARLLFADSNAGVKHGKRGLFTWLEFGDPANNVPLGTFNRCGVVSRVGVILDEAGNYTEHRTAGGGHKQIVISEPAAIASAEEVKRLILKIDDAINDAINSTGLKTIADYQNLQNIITGICGGNPSNLYWNESGNLGVYLIKYFYILHPDYFAPFYSDSKLDNELSNLGIVLQDDTLKLVKNGAIVIAAKTKNP